MSEVRSIVLDAPVVEAALVAWHRAVTITHEGCTEDGEAGMRAAIEAAAKASEGYCHHCGRHDSGCQCWNDE